MKVAQLAFANGVNGPLLLSSLELEERPPINRFIIIVVDVVAMQY